MKLIYKILLFPLLIFVFFANTSAIALNKTAAAKTFIVFNKRIFFSTEPLEIKGFLLVPLTEFLKNAGFKFYWNNEKKELTAERLEDQLKIRFSSKSSLIRVNQKSFQAPVACRVYQSNFYGPLNFVAWLVGLNTRVKGEKIIVSAKLEDLEILSEPEAETVKFKCPFPVKSTLSKSNDEQQISIDIDSSILAKSKKGFLLKSKNAQEIKISQFSLEPDVVRIIIHLRQPREAAIKKEQGFFNIILKEAPGQAGGKPRIEEKTAPSQIKEPEEKPIPYFLLKEDAGKKDLSDKMKNFRIIFRKINDAPRDFRNFSVPFIKDAEIKIIVMGKEAFLEKPVYIDNELMVPAREFLSAFENSQLIEAEGEINFFWDKYFLKMRPNSDVIDVGEARWRLPVEIKEVNQEIYLPLRPIVEYLDLGFFFDEQNSTIYLNPRIIGLALEEYYKQKQIKLVFTHPFFNIKSSYFEAPFRIVLDLENIYFDLGLAEIRFKDPDVLEIRGSQFDPKNSRVVIELGKTKTFALVSRKENREILVKLVQLLEKIAVKEEPEKTEIVLTATSFVRPQIFELKKPNRIIIDLPGLVFNAERLITVQSGPVYRLRGSQFKVDPLITRLVIDLAGEVWYEVTFNKPEKKIIFKIIPKKIGALSRKIMQSTDILKGKIIVIDPGHGGDDPGAITGGIFEKNLTLQAAKLASSLINEAGGACLLVLEEDNPMSLAERVDFAANNSAAVFISLHFNASFLKHMEGTETYYYKPEDYPLAQSIHQAMLKNLERKDNFIRKAKFFVLSHSQMPTVLIEPVYLTNIEELKLVQKEEFQEKIARGILEGLINYFKKYKK